MAVSLKLATAFVDVEVNRAPFNTGLGLVLSDLRKLQGMGVIDLRLDRGAATASLGLLRQQLDALRKDATVNVTVRQRVTGAGGRDLGGGAFGGGGAMGLGGLGGLGSGITGLAQGLGIAGFAANPAMMAGQMIGGGLKDAVSTAMDLEQTFVGLQRVSGESAANVEKFKRTIFDIGKTQAGVSIKDLTDISMAGAKAGITDKEGLAGLETFTRGMAKVRNSIQGMGTEQLANDMTRMLNLFGKGTDYVESFGSVLARMDNVSTSSASDILDMSKSLSGTFASLGMGIPQVMAFSSVLADVGLTNQQGASSFSQILRMLASQSEKMATLIGVPIDVFQEKVRTDAMGALGMLIARFREINEVDPVKAQEFLVSLGFRGVKTAGALQQLSSMFEQVQERTKMAIEEESSLGSLLSANALNSTTAIGNIQKLKNAFEELGDAIGSKVVGPLTEVAKIGLSILNQATGGKPGGPKALTYEETKELAFLQVLDPEGVAGGKTKARRDELQRKAEAYAAFQSGQPLEAGPASPAEMIKGLEKALTTAPAALRPGMEKALAELKGGIASQAAVAAAAAPAAEPGLVGPPRPIGLGLEVRGGIDFAREQDRIQAEMFRREAEDRERARAETLAGRGAALARPGAIPEVSDFRKKFMEPGELAEVERRKAMEFIARPKEEEEKARPSQMFSDPADYATHAIQAALSAKDDSPKQTAEATKRGAVLLQALVDAIVPVTKITPGLPNTGSFVFTKP
jgi:TP901 family phage tail tape measure protein